MSFTADCEPRFKTRPAPNHQTKYANDKKCCADVDIGMRKQM